MLAADAGAGDADVPDDEVERTRAVDAPGELAPSAEAAEGIVRMSSCSEESAASGFLLRGDADDAADGEFCCDGWAAALEPGREWDADLCGVAGGCAVETALELLLLCRCWW